MTKRINKKNSIAKNYIYNLVYQLLTIFLPLITTPYLSRVLGVKQIGIYGYTTSIVAYFILFGSLGLSMYGQREIAYQQNKKNKMSKIFWELVIIRLIALLISTVLFFCIFASGDKYSLYYKILTIQLVANIFDISWLFQGVEEFDKIVIRNLIVKLLCLILIFVCVKSYNDLWKYFLIYASAEFIGNLSIWLYVPKYVNKVRIRDLNIKRHIKPSLALFLPQIAIQIYTVLDKTMIGILTNNMKEVGYYEQAQKIVKSTLMIVNALQIVMNSRIANAFSNNKIEEIREYLRNTFKFIWLVAFPMMMGIVSVAYKLVPWYYGNGYDKVTNVLIVISPIIIIIGLSGTTGVQYLVQTGKQKCFTKSVVLGSVINVIINLILIPKFGGIGAAVSSVIAEACILLYQLKYCKDVINYIEILKLSIKNIISGIVMFIVISLLTYYLDVSIFNTILEILAGIIVYLIMLFLLKDKFLKDLINQLVIGIKSKRRNAE